MCILALFGLYYVKIVVKKFELKIKSTLIRKKMELYYLITLVLVW